MTSGPLFDFNDIAAELEFNQMTFELSSKLSSNYVQWHPPFVRFAVNSMIFAVTSNSIEWHPCPCSISTALQLSSNSIKFDIRAQFEAQFEFSSMARALSSFSGEISAANSVHFNDVRAEVQCDSTSIQGHSAGISLKNTLGSNRKRARHWLEGIPRKPEVVRRNRKSSGNHRDGSGRLSGRSGGRLECSGRRKRSREEAKGDAVNPNCGQIWASAYAFNGINRYQGHLQ